MSKLVCEITVRAAYPSTISIINYNIVVHKYVSDSMPKWCFYDVKFRILKVKDGYEVFFQAFNDNIFCKFFDTELDAKNYVKWAMKLAMKGNFVFHYCPICSKKKYYPTRCNTCNYNISNVKLEISENENLEKI